MQSWSAPTVPTLPGPHETALRLHDSAARGLVAVAPTGTARLYVCGITPYDATHLGHAATYLTFDTLVRVWLDQGLEVAYVQNVTDVDDPLLERATRDGQDWRQLAESQIALFRADMAALRVLPPTELVGAVEAMDEISTTVHRLVDTGAGYPVDEDVYFPVSSAPHFGELSGLDDATRLALFAERGGDPDRPGKKDPMDGLLWRAERPGEPSWPSPVGQGRPGWHVECTAIALNRMPARQDAPRLDVQGGGSDLAFPHHEHSAAIAEVLTDTWPYATASVHAGMIGLDGAKMSKSRGNLVLVSRLRADGVDPGAVRLGLLAGHYRTDRSWTDEVLLTAQERLQAWRTGAARRSGPSAAPALASVRQALAADLDTPTALAAVDAWCAASGDDVSAPDEVAALVDALLGVDLT